MSIYQSSCSEGSCSEENDQKEMQEKMRIINRSSSSCSEGSCSEENDQKEMHEKMRIINRSSCCEENVQKDVVTNVRLFLETSLNESCIMEEVVKFLGVAFSVSLNSIEDVYEVEALEKFAVFCWCQISDETKKDVLKNLKENENITRIKLTAKSKLTEELGLFFQTKSNLTHLHCGGGWKIEFLLPKLDWFKKIFTNESLTYVDCCELFRVTDELEQILYFNPRLVVKLDLKTELLVIKEDLMKYSTVGWEERYFSEGMVPFTNKDFHNFAEFDVSSSRYEKSKFQKLPVFLDFVMIHIWCSRLAGEFYHLKPECDEKGWESLTEPNGFYDISDPRKIFPAEEIETTVLKHFGREGHTGIVEIFETDSKFLVYIGVHGCYAMY